MSQAADDQVEQKLPTTKPRRRMKKGRLLLEDCASPNLQEIKSPLSTVSLCLLLLIHVHRALLKRRRKITSICDRFEGCLAIFYRFTLLAITWTRLQDVQLYRDPLCFHNDDEETWQTSPNFNQV